MNKAKIIYKLNKWATKMPGWRVSTTFFIILINKLFGKEKPEPIKIQCETPTVGVCHGGRIVKKRKGSIMNDDIKLTLYVIALVAGVILAIIVSTIEGTNTITSIYMEARKPENLSTINIIENNNNELYLVTEPCNCSNETSYYWAEDMICIGQNCTGSCHATTEICFDPEWLKQFKHALEEIER